MIIHLLCEQVDVKPAVGSQALTLKYRSDQKKMSILTSKHTLIHTQQSGMNLNLERIFIYAFSLFLLIEYSSTINTLIRVFISFYYSNVICTCHYLNEFIKYVICNLKFNFQNQLTAILQQQQKRRISLS